jgi:purine-cytosine permease-like protein
VALSCIFLEIVGAASATISGGAGFDGPGPFVSPYPRAIRDLVLLSIAVGAVAANVLNIYSGSMSFVTLGFKLRLSLRRALAAGVFGVAGFVVAAVGINHIDKYENFLLIIAYWIGPWLAVFFVDQLVNRGNQAAKLFDHRWENFAGPIAMAVGMAVSIPLFCNQSEYVAWLPKHHPKLGDLTFEVGFLVAAVVYFVLYKAGAGRRRVVELPN